MKHAMLLLAISPILWATTSISRVGVTQSQALVQYQTDQTGACTIRASRGASLGTNIPDITDNGNTDARAGSINNQGRVRFLVLGAHKANDALASDADYIVGLTCGGDSEVTAKFHTKPIQWGNTAPDILPFNAAKFGNMDQPVIDWNNTAAAGSFCDPSTHSYCDPNTGAEFWLASQPGQIQGGLGIAAYFAANWWQLPIDITGGKWTNPNNAGFRGNGGVPSVFARATGGASDKLFIPLASFGCPSGGSLWTNFDGSCHMDDVNFDLWCGNATVNNVTGFTLRLSLDGGQTTVGNTITSGNCSNAAPSKLGTFPQYKPAPVFKNWGVIPRHNQIIPPTGTVSVSGTTVTLTGTQNSSSYFSLDWPIGTPIYIATVGLVHVAAPLTSSTVLTTTENSGTPACSPNCTYTAAAFGVVLTKTNASANVDVSIGLNYSESSLPSQGSNGDTPMFNPIPVSVSKSADGSTCGIYTVGCSGGSLSPTINGYIGFTQEAGTSDAIILWIPFNSDGSPRAEVRLLSIATKKAGARIVGNGDSFPSGVGLHAGFAFDGVDGTSLFGEDFPAGSARLWKLTYNEAYGGACVGYQAFTGYSTTGNYNDSNGTVLQDDCFTWTNLTPVASGKDVKAQVMGSNGYSGAYQSGLNYLSQTVGLAHPGVDLGWMNSIGSSGPLAGGGTISLGIGKRQNHLGLLATFGSDGAGLYTIKHIRDLWGDGTFRWGGIHTYLFSMGSYRFAALDAIDDTGDTTTPFPNRNRATVSQVNRAGFGSAPSWDSNTALTSNTDYYTCPTIIGILSSFSGTTNCVQVRISTPFCQVTPNSTYLFQPSGNIERQQYPCTTPGFGNANVNYSKLQDIQLGDWLFSDLAAGYNAEQFAIVSAPSYNGTNDITFWLLRTADYVYLKPTYDCCDSSNGQGHGAGVANYTHANGWYLWAAPTLGGAGNSSNSTAVDVSNAANGWLIDNPSRTGGHNVAGYGAIPGTYNWSGLCGGIYGFYCSSTNLTPAASINIKLPATATLLPTFAGIQQPFSGMQTYQSGWQNSGTAPFPFFVDFKAINPSSPQGLEAPNGFGNTFTMTAVGGSATKTYRVSADCCTASPDYKRWGLQGFAGRFWMKDVSSPATFTGGAADMADWSVCRARNANECVSGSTAGQLFMTVPQRDIQTTCYSSNFGIAVPCLSSFGPVVGQVVQFRVDNLDALGRNYRKIGFGHNHIGLGYQFSNARPTPDGQFAFVPGYWLDGVRTEWLAVRMGPMPPVDSVDRTNFVPVSVSLRPGLTYARVRFGYAENGNPASLLACTGYQQDCSTEIPSGAPTDPFSFTNEAVTRTPCGTGCTITIPSLPNRILYYVVDRLDASGTVVHTDPMQAVAVP